MNMGDHQSASASSYGQFCNLPDLPDASGLDPFAINMVSLEDNLPCNELPSDPLPMYHSAIHGTAVDGQAACWMPSQNKVFEVALAQVDEHDPQRWEKIAAWVPGKTVEQVKEHYQCLVDDIESIHLGLVPIPCYVDDPLSFKKASHEPKKKKDNEISAWRKMKEKEAAATPKKMNEKEAAAKPKKMNEKVAAATPKKKKSGERRKGVPWTEEEHWYTSFVILFVD